MKNYAKEQTIGATNMCSHTIMHVRLKRKLFFYMVYGFILHKEEAGKQNW